MAGTEPERKTPRKIKALLFVSLALNLMVAGLVAGAIWRHGPDGRDARGPHKDPLLWSLERSDRRAVGEAVQSVQGADRRARGRAIAAALRNVQVTLAAQPFDAEAFKSAMREKTALLRRTRDAGEAAMIERIIAMSDAERASMAERLDARLSRREKWHDGR